MKKIVLLAIALFIIASSGCTQIRPEVTKISDFVNTSIPNNSSKTIIISNQYRDFPSYTITIIVGNLTDIRSERGILVFEDGTMVQVYGAGNVRWKYNKIHLIILRNKETWIVRVYE